MKLKLFRVVVVVGVGVVEGEGEGGVKEQLLDFLPSFNK